MKTFTVEITEENLNLLAEAYGYVDGEETKEELCVRNIKAQIKDLVEQKVRQKTIETAISNMPVVSDDIINVTIE